MKKFAFAILGIVALLGTAQAATTLTINSCTADAVSFSFESSDTDARVLGYSSVDNGSYYGAFYNVSSTSDNVSYDFASGFGHSTNANLSFILYDGSDNATATCP